MPLSLEKFNANIHALLELADRQLHLARQDDWEGVEKMEQQKGPLLRATFDGVTDDGLHDDGLGQLAIVAREAIEKIQQKEQQLRQLTEAASADSKIQRQKLQRGNKAKQAYSQKF